MLSGGDAAFRVSVDVVALTVLDDRLSVLVSRRAEPPYRGRWGLPGCDLVHDEDLEATARRALRERTGRATSLARIEQLATYGAPRRDPRRPTVSVAWLAVLPVLAEPGGGRAWKPADRLLASGRLAFDHGRLLADGVERARAKLEYTSLGAVLIPEPFTINELRGVYGAVWGREPDARNFHRKVSTAEGFVEPTDETTTRSGGRPARLYRRGTARLLHPPMLRA